MAVSLTWSARKHGRPLVVEEVVDKSRPSPAARFFLFNAIAIAMKSVLRQGAQRVQLSTGRGNDPSVHVWMFREEEEQDGRRMLVAHSNDMCLFTGGAPSLYVREENAGSLEHAIYLYLSERFKGEGALSVQIIREGAPDLPVLTGNSHMNHGAIKAHAQSLQL